MFTKVKSNPFFSVIECLKPRRDVFETRFEKSGHVAHFKMYPEEYTAAIKKFLRLV